MLKRRTHVLKKKRDTIMTIDKTEDLSQHLNLLLGALKLRGASL